ncbi:MAG TPA: glutamine synthetase [Xanthobacteraceae bacterium]|nr:glutamine synthetase [Xanthobacteraceae bacterium]
MNPEEVKTAAQARAIVEKRRLSHVKVGVFDTDGILRGKSMSREKFFSALESGFGFCDVVLGWDSNDQLYDNVSLTGWHTAYPDAHVRILPATCRAVPLEGDMLLFLGEFDGEAEAVCPRGTLRRVLQRADGMGYAALASAEFEFFLFDETPHSVREKNFRDLKTLTPGFFGYSLLRASVHAEFHEALLKLCSEMRFPLEGLHTETGPGVLEAAITYSNALEAADRAALFKTFTKILAERRGMMATFMAKWSRDWPGQSGHLHVSLQDKRAKPVFHAARKPHAIADEMRWFIGGQQALLPELLAMVAPTVNSYTRLIPGFWAPTDATWGIENRTCALRAILGSPKSQRIEYRIAAADINPYIALSAAIGSGLWGIEHKIEPDAPVEGSAYGRSYPPERQLPRTLWESAQRLKESDAARALFGEAFVEHYAATREWEEREFRKAITDWELARYFEII